MLHNKKDTFEQLVLRTSEYLGVKAEIVEKDYFVTLFLKRIAAVMPDIVFKGGTSLSKCYHIIKRFSEQINGIENLPEISNHSIYECTTTRHDTPRELKPV
jgi:predicted nucleotidyltransferase component of viral defense system